MPLTAIGAVPQTCVAWRTSLDGEAAVVDEIIKIAVQARFPGILQSPLAQLAPASNGIRWLYQKRLSQERDRQRFALWKRTWRISAGHYGECYRAFHKQTDETSVLRKCSSDEGVPEMVLREIGMLKALGPHANILQLLDVFPSHCDGRRFWLCFESCQSDLKQYMRAQNYQLSAACIRSLTHQMLTGLAWCHAHSVLHRDLKPQHLLVDTRRGGLQSLKIGAFRSARVVDPTSGRTYTFPVVTRWYRAPELLLGETQYTSAIDVWSAGCIVAEMLSGHPLFPGHAEIDELFQIFRTLGTPTDATWPGVSALPAFNEDFPKWKRKPPRQAMPHPDRLNDAGVDLVVRCLSYAPSARPTAQQASEHPYFADLCPQTPLHDPYGGRDAPL